MKATTTVSQSTQNVKCSNPNCTCVNCNCGSACSCANCKKGILTVSLPGRPRGRLFLSVINILLSVLATTVLLTFI